MEKKAQHKPMKPVTSGSAFDQARSAMIGEAQHLSQMFASVHEHGEMPMEEGAFRLLQSYTFLQIAKEVAVQVSVARADGHTVELMNAVLQMDY